MRTRNLLITGAVVLLGIVLAAAAVAQYQDNNKSVQEYHECTPEMMEAGNMSQNCPAGIMKSGDCEKMSGAGMQDCSSMMENARGVHMSDPNHCGSMGDNSNSMMGSKKKAAIL